ncbi:hypothetical protein J4734_22005 [Klebsiella pneumoniae]|uniref:Uncharacterized protein n=1 Tax=Klebsiella pneumoniae TaxID=573 RepID=A0A939SQC3_KLEPN|nr:hypothetical protein [Klebsiella pneumoniae]
MDLAPERAPASHARPFILTLGLIFLGFSGLGISVWPNIIPPHLLWMPLRRRPAVFMLPGALLIIPVILMYTARSYYRLSRQSLRQRGLSLSLIRAGR